MIGARTLGLLVIAALVAAIAVARGLLAPSYLMNLSAASCIAIGVFASLAAALVAVGWRPGERSRTGLDVRRLRFAADARRPPRELPAAVQHALFAGAFVCLGLGAIDNRAAAALTELPAALAEPSPSDVCPEEGAPVATPPPTPPPAEIPGCALVQRAYKLGYTDSLGSCAPPTLAPAAPPERRPVCTRRQRDEPFLHYGWRRLVDQFGSLAGTDPVEAASDGVRAIAFRLDHLDTFVAHQGHAVAATRRASHHLWTNLPAPGRRQWLRSLLDPTPCAVRYEALPLWRSFEGEEQAASAVVDHVIGQLLFAPGFAEPHAQCGDYVVHWDAPEDACRRLVADPEGFLSEHGALEPVREVLDRRQRQIEMGRLDAALGRRIATATPPDPRAIVSFQCFAVGPAASASGATAGAGAVSGRDVVVDGQRIAVRELRAPPVRAGGAGPIDVYRHMAALLAGGSLTGGGADTALQPAAPGTGELDAGGYLLTRLERLRDADPFAGVSAPLDRPDLVEVYPFHRHLHAFVDDFRRRYWADRGRM